MRARLPFVTAAVLFWTVQATFALAGQVRIDVSNSGGANAFFPATASLNFGDQVAWVWLDGTHTVTSGSSCTPNGLFNSGSATYNPSAGTAFSWKSNASGSQPYYCAPHCLMGMTATLNVAASGVAVADFRITEVQYNLPNGHDLIEIANLGNAAGDLGRFRLLASNDNATVPLNSFVVLAGGRVTVHVNVAGTHSPPTDLYLPTLADLPTSGSLALFMPYTVSGAGSTGATQMVDFVQWGGPGFLYEDVAQTAGFWTPGHYLQTVGAGHSIEFCGDAADRGAVNWAEIAVPNFGSNGGCTTPTLKSTWGRLKAIYR
jgi:plastocyanin